MNERVNAIDAAIVLALGFSFTVVAWLLPSIRVGDGSEYYALFLAFTETYRPWMSAGSWETYQRLFESNLVQGFVQTEQMAAAFPQLVVGDTADFNHFWFYSFLAAVVGIIPYRLGLSDPTIIFGLTNGLLIAIPAVMARRAYGMPGLLAVLSLVFTSYLIWFVNKAHTEVFTVALVAASVVAIMQKRVLLSAVFLSIASTQNLPLAGPAFVLCAVYTLWNIRRLTPQDILLLALCALFAGMHPTYYFWRIGVVTPQLLFGADVGGGLQYFYVWLVDPDLGLLPNWPAGLCAVAFGTWIFVKRSEIWPGDRAAFVAFAILYTAICLFAQSSTTNMNSGATPGPSRYGLWYAPLAIPFIIATFRWLEPRLSATAAIGAGLVIVLANAAIFHPFQNESYHTPTGLSFVIQRFAPWAYSPPFEVYLDRYSGLPEPETHTLKAVIGPDCQRVLLIASQPAGVVGNRYGCPLSPNAEALLGGDNWHLPMGAAYTYFPVEKVR